MLRIASFCVGVLIAGLFPHLPPPWLIAALAGVAAPVCWWRTARPVALLMLGLGYGLACGHFLVAKQLDVALEGREILVQGTISDLPIARDNSQRFLLDVSAAFPADDEAQRETAPEKRVPIQVADVVQLTWYQYGELPQELKVGQQWQLLVRLKRPRGFVNRGGFDYQRWLLSRGIGATGYIRRSSLNRQLKTPPLTPSVMVQSARGQIRDRIADNPKLATAEFLAALSVGDTSMIAPSQWSVLQATGTSHLMAISGLHVGLLALLGFWFGHGLRALLSLSLRSNVWPLYLPALFSITFALTYSALAGFALPTQRAVAMTVAVNLALAGSRNSSVVSALVWALLCVLLLDPLAGYDAGFWLSFGAVATLLWRFRSRFSINNKAQAGSKDPYSGSAKNLWTARIARILAVIARQLAALGKAQWALFVGLCVPLLALQLSPSLVAPLANLVAVPVVSLLVVVPMLASALLHGVSEPLALVFLNCADGVMHWLWSWLQELSAWQRTIQSSLPAGWSPTVNSWFAMASSLLAAALLLAPRGVPARVLGIVFFLPIFMAMPLRESAALRVVVLDVGQGLAVAIHTPNHTLVYDTGPQFSERFSAGDAIVANYLRAEGIREIDTVVVSHADDDHAGGMAALNNSMPVGRWLVGEHLSAKSESAKSKSAKSESEKPELTKSESVKSQIATASCHQSPAWTWDDVTFRFLDGADNRDREAENNNLSCVLLVTWRDHRLLLPGDIESERERELLHRQLLPGNIDVLVVPHHGSLTSSSPNWVGHLDPDIAIFSAGYRNRYGHPHPKVVRRYEQQNARLLSTAEDGQITVSWYRPQSQPQVLRRRHHRPRYWYAQSSN